jgi:hypothetical protein
MAISHMHFVRQSPLGDLYAAVGPRDRLIAEAAYYLAQSRGFVPGYEVDDWLAAEREVDSRLASEAYRH